MYELKQQYGNQIEFTYINVNDPAVRADSNARGFRVGTPQLTLHGVEGEVLQQWFGQFTREQIEPSFAQLFTE